MQMRLGTGDPLKAPPPLPPTSFEHDVVVGRGPLDTIRSSFLRDILDADPGDNQDEHARDTMRSKALASILFIASTPPRRYRVLHQDSFSCEWNGKLEDK